MSRRLQKLGPKEAFLAWAEAQEGRYEFDGKVPVAIPADTVAHSIILHNLQVALSARMHGSRYRAYPENCRLETIGVCIRCPDCLIIGSPQERNARTIKGAVVVFEVAPAPSTPTASSRCANMRP